MQLHIEESFSTSSSLLNICIQNNQKRPNNNLEHIFIVVIAYAKWRAPFLHKQKKI